MMWPNSGVSCSTHQRRTNLFIPQRVEYSIESLVRFTFLWAEVTVLAVPLVNGSPNLLYPIHVCHFHRLFLTIIAVVDVMLTRRSTQSRIDPSRNCCSSDTPHPGPPSEGTSWYPSTESLLWSFFGSPEGNRQHGDFSSKERKPNQRFNRIFYPLRDEKVCSTLVGRAWHSRVWPQHCCWHNASNA